MLIEKLFMLPGYMNREDMPCVQRLIVRRFQIERLHLGLYSILLAEFKVELRESLYSRSQSSLLHEDLANESD